MTPPEMEAVDALIERAGQLHTPPEVATTLLKLTADDDFDIHEVVACVERDPAMTAKMLQVVNSSRFGLRSKVGNLQQAIAYLGQRTVRLVAMTFSVVETFSCGPARKLYNDYWQHALTIASACSRLADKNRAVDKNDAYAAGLLADIGSLVLAQVEGDAYVELYRQTSTMDLSSVEREKLGFDHAVVGARLLQRWEFPADTVEAVLRHHDDSVATPLAVATRAGALLSGALWDKDEANVQQCAAWLNTHFDIDLDEFTELALACKEEVTLEAELYGVNLELTVDCRELIEQAHRQHQDVSLQAMMDLDSIESMTDGSVTLDALCPTVSVTEQDKCGSERDGHGKM